MATPGGEGTTHATETAPGTTASAGAESPMPQSFVRGLQVPAQTPPASPGRRDPARTTDDGTAELAALVCCVIS